MRLHDHRQFRIYRQRGLFLRIGFAVALLLVIWAFSWKREVNKQEQKEATDLTIIIVDTVYRIPAPTPPEPKTKKPKTQEQDIKIVEGTTGQANQPDESSELDFSLDDGLTSNVIEEYIDKVSVPKNYVAPEKYPEFPGGLPAFFDYIKNNVRFPVDFIQNHNDDTVYVTFVIDQMGKVVDAKVAKGVMPSIDAEALRLVEGSPRWSPGMMGARPVRVIMTLPIRFKVSRW